MLTQVIMPRLGESVVEGTVGRWLIQEGQPVQADEPLLAVTTDKVDTELPAPATGVLLKIYVAEGQTVAAGALLAEIGAAGELPAETEPAAAGSASSGFISPAVGRLAVELGVDLDQVIGTGADGRITKKDVLAYVATPAPRGGELAGPPRVVEAFPEPGFPAAAAWPEATGEAVSTGTAPDWDLVPLSALRRSIAEHMVASQQAAPHVTTVMEVDLARLVAVRERLKGEFERQGARLTFTPFFIQAVVAGLKARPEANSSFTEQGLRVYRSINVGVAVAIDEGLIVPVIRNADEHSLFSLASAVNDLAERARTRRLAPDEVRDGTFTLSNHGTAGSLLATPIINQPQTGILGIGAIRKRAVVLAGGCSLLPDAEDVIAIRPMAYLSFTFDHRVLDGQSADGFLAVVKAFLEEYSA